MEPLVDTFKKFIARDALYILGGWSVILATLYCVDSPLDDNSSTALIVFLSGVAYVLGYSIQELFSMTPFLTTQHFVPKGLVSFFYKQFTGKDVPGNLPSDSLNAFINLYAHLTDRQMEQLDRVVNLKQVGSAMGPNWIVAGIILAIRAVNHGWQTIDILLFAASFFFGIFLIIMCWVKGVQQMQIFSYVAESVKDKLPKSD